MKSESQIHTELETLETRRRRLRKELRKRKSERIGTVIRKGRGSRDRDEELKRQRGYKDSSSYVRRDGSEVLHGEDWRKRKAELRERSGGQCEFTLPAGDGFSEQRCLHVAYIPAHVSPRHPRRNDEIENLRHYCGPHDKLMEKQAWRKTRFGEKA